MSRRQKIIVVALAVVLVVLHTAAVANQSRTGQGGRSEREGGLVGWLGDRLAGPTAADPDDLSADCRGPGGRLVFDDSCTIEVAPGGRFPRVVPLRVDHLVEVTAPAVAGDFTVGGEVEPGETVRVAVGRGGAEIELECLDSGDSDDCVVRIGGDDG